MANPQKDLGAAQEIYNVSVGKIIHSVAKAIADTQFQMDKDSIAVAEFMSGRRLLRDPDSGQLLTPNGEPSEQPHVIDTRVDFGYDVVDGDYVPSKASMLELGFIPNFYQFAETHIEVKLAMKAAKTEDESGRSHIEATGTSVDANYSSTYNFDANMASTVRTRIVPIPPPVGLDERIRRMVELRTQRQLDTGEAA